MHCILLASCCCGREPKYKTPSRRKGIFWLTVSEVSALLRSFASRLVVRQKHGKRKWWRRAVSYDSWIAEKDGKTQRDRRQGQDIDYKIMLHDTISSGRPHFLSFHHVPIIPSNDDLIHGLIQSPSQSPTSKHMRFFGGHFRS